MALAWPTGDEPPSGEFIERSLSIPDELALVTAVTGALLPLTEAENWEQITGDLTAEEAASLMETMFYDFLESG